MTTLKDIKLDFPDWPDDVIDQWLLKFANQPKMVGRHPIRWRAIAGKF
jgi:hypothetical protein